MTTKIKLPDAMPSSMAKLPRDDIGRPIPFFVAWVDGKPDFRYMDSKALRDAIMRDLCWVCGRRMDPRTRRVFAAGPMCLINGTSAEPPAHYKCAWWSVQACPFLLNPNKVRRETNVPDEVGDPAGIMVKRNPGVIALIEPTRWWVENHGGVLCRFTGCVRSVEWWREGRPATRAEVVESIDAGLPALAEIARQEGLEALAELMTMVELATVWLPADVPAPDRA